MIEAHLEEMARLDRRAMEIYARRCGDGRSHWGRGGEARARGRGGAGGGRFAEQGVTEAHLDDIARHCCTRGVEVCRRGGAEARLRGNGGCVQGVGSGLRPKRLPANVLQAVSV